MKTSLTIIITMLVVSGMGIILERVLRNSHHRSENHEDYEECDNYAERTTPQELQVVPVPFPEDKECPTIDRYKAAELELVFYASVLAAELRQEPA